MIRIYINRTARKPWHSEIQALSRRMCMTASTSTARPRPCSTVLRAGDLGDLGPSAVVLSGIQPTGVPHIGNWIGALRQWQSMQTSVHQSGGSSLFCVVDLHALTVPNANGVHHRNEFATACFETACAILACGVDPERSALFLQSDVPEHSELAWILSCTATLGALNRMTQFKDKKSKSHVLGIYSYPVLMTADILVYRASHVPVGEDQRQHLELARDIASAFNAYYGNEVFPLPSTVNADTGTRVMSLRDGSSKMSKSDPSEASRIVLTDSDDDIRRKIRRAKTDSEARIYADPENRPEVTNLLGIAAALLDLSSPAEAERHISVSSGGAFKNELADLVISHVAPVRQRLLEFSADRSYIEQVLRRGSESARERADRTMKDVRRAIGLGFGSRTGSQ